MSYPARAEGLVNSTSVPDFSQSEHVSYICNRICFSTVGLVIFHGGKQSRADFIQVPHQQATGNLCHFCEKVCGFTACLRIHVNVHERSINDKKLFCLSNMRLGLEVGTLPEESHAFPQLLLAESRRWHILLRSGSHYIYIYIYIYISTYVDKEFVCIIDWNMGVYFSLLNLISPLLLISILFLVPTNICPFRGYFRQ